VKRINNNVSSVLAIVLFASAVIVIGGLTVISSPTSTMQSASAAGRGFHVCFQELDAEACTSGGVGEGQGGGGHGGKQAAFACNDDSCITPQVSGGGGEGQGGGGGGGIDATCGYDINGEPVCESVPGGGGGRH
jgi:hypothetical protein